MKKTITLTLLAMFNIAASAYDFYVTSVGGSSYQTGTIDLYYAINADGKTVTLVEGPETYSCDYVQIPEQVKNPNDGKTYTVKIIGTNAFSSSFIKEIKMPNSIEEIQEYAFYRSYVERVEFSHGLKYIRNGAFWDCWHLKSVELYDGLLSIGERAFSECQTVTVGEGLKSVILPETVTEIRPYAFAYNGDLTSINLPMNLKEIEEGVFCCCSSLTQVTLPTALEKIHKNAFDRAGLSTISFPSKLKEIEDYGFFGCNFTELTLPSTLQQLGDNVFSDCLSLKECTVNFSMNTLPVGTFQGCQSLTKATINTKIKKIDDFAFEYCEQLVEINMPNSVMEIGGGAFSGCRRLSSISLSDNISVMGAEAFRESGLQDFTFPSKLNYISNGMFSGCTKLITFTVPSTINEIQDNAFSYCTSLRSISLPNTISTLPIDCFNGCSAFTTLNIPSSVTLIETRCFCDCVSLKSIELPDNLTEIGSSSFQGCTKLESISIPKSVTDMHPWLFKGCISLKEVLLPASLDRFGDNSFDGCSSLASVYLPTTLPPTIGYWNSSLIGENKATLYVPYGSKETYEGTKLWQDFSNIEEMDFEDCFYVLSTNGYSPYGKVLINGDEEPIRKLEDGQYLYKVAKGSDVNIAIELDDSYLKKYSLFVDDIDITEEGVENKYTISNIQKNTKLDIVYEDGAPNGFHLITKSISGSFGTPTVLINNEDVSQWYDQEGRDLFVVKDGEDVHISITPPENVLEKYTLSINGTDVTDDVVNDEYTIKGISEDILVEVLFESGAPNGYHLITKSISGSSGTPTVLINNEDVSQWYDEEGRDLFVVKDGEDVHISITPPEDVLEKYTLLINGMDVTDEIVNDEFSIKGISEDILVEILFEPGAPKGYHIVTTNVPEYDGEILVNGENSSQWCDEESHYQFKVKEGTDVNIRFNSYYFEWPYCTLHVNGKDVSAQIKDGEYIIKDIQEDVLLEAWFKEGVPMGIDYISQIEAGQVELYNVQGQRVENPIPGHIYVTKDGKKIVVRKSAK